MEWIISVITIFGTVASVTGVVLYVFNGTKKIIQEINERTIKLDEHFAKLDEHFAKMDERFAKMDERFAKMDERFAKLDERFAKLDERFAKLAERHEETHKEVVQLLMRMTDLIEARLPSVTYPNAVPNKT